MKANVRMSVSASSSPFGRPFLFSSDDSMIGGGCRFLVLQKQPVGGVCCFRSRWTYSLQHKVQLF
jgi:hypothetical protein